MKVHAKVAFPLMLCSSIAAAEEYHWISGADFTRTDTRIADFDAFSLGSTWYFDGKETLGPLNEFAYINTTSNIFGSWSRFDGLSNDADQVGIGGEYFAGNLLLGGSYLNLDDVDFFTGTVGYLFSENFLVSVDAAKVEGAGTNYLFNARYNHPLRGNAYLGFNFSTDDEFDGKNLSSRYFTPLAGNDYLALEVSWSIFDDADEELWAVEGDYYFSERTSLGLGIAEDEVYSFDFTHFFNENVALELGYTTSDDDSGFDFDVDSYQLGVTFQF